MAVAPVALSGHNYDATKTGYIHFHRSADMVIDRQRYGGSVADRRVLELRIHGINNTAPAGMLDLPESSIERAAGDALGSFWRPTAEARDKLPPDGPDSIDPSVEREAYSWGGMARSSVGGSSGAGIIVRGAARVGWALLLPFGLVNVAYWARRFDDGPPSPPAERTPASSGRPTDWRGAASLRLAGLLITLLMAVTAAVIALDLIGVQCYQDKKLVCAKMPSQIGFLAHLEQTQRLAVVSAVPVLLMLFLAGLSAATRLRYEQPDPRTPNLEASNVDPAWPVLSTRGLWAHRAITKATSRLHVAATASLMSTITAWHVAFGGTGDACDTRDEALTSACLNQAWTADARSRFEVIIVIAGIAMLLLIAYAVMARSDDAGDIASSRKFNSRWQRYWRARLPGGAHFRAIVWWRRIWTVWLPVGGSLLVFAAQIVILITAPRPEPIETRLLGISAVLALLLAALIGLALSGLIWRSCASGNTIWRHLPMPLAALFAAALLLSGFPAWRWWAISAAIFVAVLVLVIRYTKRNQFEAWGGAAPGVILFVAILLAMILSSAVVVATGDWLNGGNGAAALASNDGAVVVIQPCPYSCGTATILPDLQVPLPYIWFGPAMVVLILLISLVAAVGWWRSATWTPPAAGGLARAAGVALPSPPISARKMAAFAQRAEPLGGALAMLGALAVATAVAIGLTGHVPAPNSWLRYGLDAGMWVLAMSGLTIIGLAVGGSVLGGARPLGLVWDLICFLPRTGHPLAPPCYAERVVPELAQRCRVWLDEASDRRIVLSAHSLGAVLAVGVILSARISGSSTPRISLLTYGTQLRAYFGRIFPELLGPRVLDTPGCRSARLVTPDPWGKEIEHQPPDAPELPVGHPRSLRGRLGDGRPRWRSLWRRTDYLGFPVWSYTPNSIDIAAAEVLTVDYLAEVQTHSGYPRTDAYRRAFSDLTTDTPVTTPSDA